MEESAATENLEIGEVTTRKRHNQRYKYHQDLTQDPEITALTKKYDVVNAESKLPISQKVSEEDVLRILDRYSQDLTLDLYTIASAFGVTASSISELLKSDKYKNVYAAAKQKRGAIVMQQGLKVAGTPFEKIQQGQEVSMVEVAAAKLYSNYQMSYGQALNHGFIIPKQVEGEGGGVNVVVQTGIKLNF